MSPMGGGLMQLVAYGAQDCYLSGTGNNDYCVDDCFTENTKMREYNNFNCVKRTVYENGNRSFTNNKYNEYCIKIRNAEFMKFKPNNEYGYTIKCGNDDLQLALLEQKNLANKLRRDGKSITDIITNLIW
jgi:hypothetical protein